MNAGTGPKVELKLFENTGKAYSGVLNYCDNQISPDTAALAMRADFGNADGSLTPGMFGTISLAGETRKGALLVPESAIGTDLVGRYVMVVGKDSKIAYRHVEVGTSFREVQDNRKWSFRKRHGCCCGFAACRGGCESQG